jgi:DNA helicase HerA-like ATPase
VLNKVEAFLAFPSLKNILGQSPSTLDMSYAMDHQRIVIVNLAMGTIGDTGARPMGALILAHLRAAAMSRARLPQDERKPFHLICDEAHAFGSASMARLLQEIRKFAVSVTIATQYLDALTDDTRAALLGNAKTLVVFRCAPGDADVLSPHFDRLHQDFNQTALLELNDGEAMISAPNQPAARIEIPPPQPLRSPDRVKQQSRRHYGRPRADVERFIERTVYGPVGPQKPAPRTQPSAPA